VASKALKTEKLVRDTTGEFRKVPISKTLRDVMQSPDKEAWLQAMQNEIDSHAPFDGAFIVADDKSITGGAIMLGGCMLDPACLRQHLAAPDAHTSEVHATSTVQHRCAPRRGLLQEMLVPQPHPTPLYLDSASTIFAGNDKDGITHLDGVSSGWRRPVYV
jgi:hypothetical protein